MKKILTLALLFVVIPFIAQAGDFRKATWGMTRDVVEKLESGENINTQGTELFYSGSIANLNTLYGYFFTDNKLSMGKYMITEKHSNNTTYILDFKKLKELLVKKYGQPKEDDQLWTNNLFKDSYEDWGTAISVGHMIYMAKWETETTEVLLALMGDNYKINLVIEYYGKEFKDATKKAAEKEALDDL